MRIITYKKLRINELNNSDSPITQQQKKMLKATERLDAYGRVTYMSDYVSEGLYDSVEREEYFTDGSRLVTGKWQF